MGFSIQCLSHSLRKNLRGNHALLIAKGAFYVRIRSTDVSIRSRPSCTPVSSPLWPRVFLPYLKLDCVHSLLLRFPSRPPLHTGHCLPFLEHHVLPAWVQAHGLHFPISLLATVPSGSLLDLIVTDLVLSLSLRLPPNP